MTVRSLCHQEQLYMLHLQSSGTYTQTSNTCDLWLLHWHHKKSWNGFNLLQLDLLPPNIISVFKSNLDSTSKHLLFSLIVQMNLHRAISNTFCGYKLLCCCSWECGFFSQHFLKLWQLVLIFCSLDVSLLVTKPLPCHAVISTKVQFDSNLDTFQI